MDPVWRDSGITFRFAGRSDHEQREAKWFLFEKGNMKKKSKVALVAAVGVSAFAVTGFAWAAYSNNLTGAIDVLGESVSPATCDNNGVLWTLGAAAYNTVNEEWRIPSISFSDVHVDCNGKTLRYVLLMADGSVIQNSTATIMAETGDIAFSPQMEASTLEGFEVQYLIQ